MRYKLKYSPDAGDKLKEIRAQVTESYGKEVAAKTVSKIMKEIKGLTNNLQKGPSVEVLLGRPTPYRVLHVGQNYVFYRIESAAIYVTDIYNEWEDFLRRMFHISLRTQDSIDYWGEKK